MVRIDHNSDFKCIRERSNQVYAIERELIIFTKLIVVNKARLHHFDEHSLRSASDVCPICTAECRASLVEVKLLRYLGRPPKGQTEGAIHVDDPHFTSWLHVYMLTDIHSPLIDRNLGNVDTQGDTINMYSLPIHCPWQQCLQAICDALQEVLLPPSHPTHHEGSDNNQYINRLYYQSIGGVDEDGNCSFASHNSAHKLINDHLQWLCANVNYLTCELKSYAKDKDGFIMINLPQHEQLSEQQDRERWACLESTPQRRRGDGPREQLSEQRDRERQACLESTLQRRQGDGPRQMRPWQQGWSGQK